MTSSNILWPRMITKSLANALRSIRRIANLANAFLVLCLIFSAQLATAGSAGNGSHQGGTDHYYCTSNDKSQSTIYFSAEFDFSWPPGSVRVQDSVIGNEFKQALAAKYGYQGSVVCFGTKSKTQTQAQLQSGISGARSSGKWTVVETGWIWSGAKVPGGGASGPSAAAQRATVVNSNQDSLGSAESGSAPGGSESSGSASGGSEPANSAGQAQNLPAAGTTLAVRILESVDSSKDPAGKQYRATVTTAAEAGNGLTISRDSMATVTLMKDQGGWSAHLQSVVVKGQTVNVSSAPATVMGSAQGTASNAVSTVTSMMGSFGRFGHKPPKPAGVQAIATGDRVLLPPGTQLRFVLSGASAPGGEMASAGGESSLGGPSHPGGGNPAGVASSSATGEPASGGTWSAKIQETPLGPSKQAGLFVVSPDGGHYAVTAMHGSRELVIVDGVDGPEFDHAAHTWGGQALDFVFNSDGKHSAYVAQSGDEMVEVRDGKTAFTITSIKRLSNGVQEGIVLPIDQSRIHNPDAPTSSLVHQCVISPSGAHVAVVSTHSSTSEPLNYYLFLDGVRSQSYRSIDLSKIAFVAEKLVYVAQTNDGKFHVVVNDKLGPPHDGVLTLLVNQDNNHYAYIAADGGANGSNQVVVVDGIPGTPHRGAIRNLTIASNGRVAYEAVVGGTPGSPNGSDDLYVDGHSVGPVVHPFAVVDKSGKGQILEAYVVFSPDGKRVAYVRRVPGGMAAVVDGKVGRAYDSIGVFQFSPDSKYDFYVGQRNLNFVVLDGQEMQGEGTVTNFLFSQISGRFAYLAYSPQAGFRMVIDGKQSPRFQEFVANSMSFSADGKHYAYAIHANFSQCAIIRDGITTNVPSLVPFTTRARPGIDFPPLFFSEDGKRLVWAWPKSDGVSGNVISINSQEITHGHGAYEFPGFSPDSQHFATMIWNGHTYALSVDGKAGTTYDDFLEVNPNVARFLDSHTYRFLGVKGGMVYRVMENLGG